MTFGLKIILFAIFAVMLLSAFIGAVKSNHFFKSIFLTALQGFGALCAVNLSAMATGISLPINYITLSIGGLFGLPGVILLLCINLIL